MQSTPLALAFSGGLDTSYCVPRLAEQGYAVHTVFVNTGGASPEELAAIRRQAMTVGAVEHHEVDARDEVFGRFVSYLIQGNILRGEVYPLSVSAERAVSITIGVEIDRARRSRHTSKPFFFGSITSRITRSGVKLAAFCSPSSPSAAVSTS